MGDAINSRIRLAAIERGCDATATITFERTKVRAAQIVKTDDLSRDLLDDLRAVDGIDEGAGACI